MISPSFRLTDARLDLPPPEAVDSLSQSLLPVGCYNDGLITVLDGALGQTLLASWRPKVGHDSVAFLATGLGDVFFWKPGAGVHFLEVQRSGVEFIDANLDWFLSDFLSDDQVVGQLLRRSYLSTLVSLNRPLAYGEVFILEPWLMLGGNDSPECYGIGTLKVYLDLVWQTISN